MELNPDTDKRLAWGRQVLEALVRWEARRLAQPIRQPVDDARIDAMLAPPPEAGVEDLSALLDTLFAVAGDGWSKAHGGDLSFIPNGGLYSGTLAALVAAGLHRYTGAALETPALIALEEGVLRWWARLLGLPEGSEGVMLSGGSLANQTAIACARAQGFDPARSTAYLSQRAHHSLRKGLRLSGVPMESVREVPTDSATRFDIDALRATIRRDQAEGRRPWLIVGTAGSTDTGAIDDLVRLAEVARESGAWFHVDAAYGGFFVLTERGARRLHGIGLADSITVDAHKGLFLPYGISAVLVRHPGALERAHQGTGAYQQDLPRAPRVPHYYLRGPELTRPARGVLAWLPLHLHGVGQFRAALDRCLDLAEESARQLATMPGIECLGAPVLSVVAFRATAGNAATQAIHDAINASGRFHVSSTTLDGRITTRFAFLHLRTSAADLEELLRIVREASHVTAHSPVRGSEE
jgi:aromatic-L-amino-acid/L-tryptophan decarboxylase